MTEKSDELLFQECNNKIKALKLNDVDKLNLTIDQLNALNYRNIPASNEIAEDLFFEILKLIPKENDHLVSKFCSLVYLFLNKQERMLSKNCTCKLTEFHIMILQNCGEWLLNDILIALSAVFYKNGDKIDKQYHKSLLGENGVLTALITPSKHVPSVQYHTFQCIINLLTHCSSENHINAEYLENCCQKCIAVTKQQFERTTSDVLSLKILVSCLKCFQFLFATKNVYVENFGELLGILKCLLFYGLPGPTVNDLFLHPTLSTPDQSLVDSQGESDTGTHPKLRKQKRTRRTRSKRPQQKKDLAAQNEEKVNYNQNNYSGGASNTPTSSPSAQRAYHDMRFRSSSSDSEFSDAENCASRMRSLQASVRQNAYQALQTVVKNTDKKIMFGYWSSFLPDHPAIPGMTYSQNIFSTILKDPASQVRLGALVLLTEMLKGTKNFLSFADGRSVRHSSFTSLSSIIATIVSELHRCLLLALLAENNNLLLTQILKCYAVLCENAPYNKLNDEILLKLLKNLKKFLYHKDTQVEVACLTVFSSIVNSDLVPQEIGQLLISSDFDSETSSDLVSNMCNLKISISDVPWIVRVCMKNIFCNEPLPVQIESLQLLSGIVRKYFLKISCILTVLEDIILFCLNKDEPSLQLHGAKLLDVFGRCLGNCENKSEDQEIIVKRLWLGVLNGPLASHIKNESQKTLLAVSCDCLSTLSPDIFETLPSKQQIFYITVLLGLASDSNPNVRGAAIRCLGVYSLFPCLMKDISFLSDVSDILIKVVEDPNVNVRFKSSWSLGNLSDAMFLNKPQSSIIEEISEQFFYSTGMACVQYSKDCDRVRTNSVRALGNFLYYLPDEFLTSSRVHHFIRSATAALISALSANVMKVCWNACYALGKMLKNNSLINLEVVNLEVIICALLNLLKSPNFKVRISASQALTVVQSRNLYGKLFPKIWLEIVAALFSTAADVNFKEIRHQENLSDQLCYSLCQLVIIANVEDFQIISYETLQASEMLLTSMWKFGTHLSEDKMKDVCRAVEHLNHLQTENNETPSVNILQDILNQVLIAFYGRDSK